jgi:DNA-binding transcriptional ArsR family regulator
MRRDVFQALADPTRRAILDLLTERPLTVNGVADRFAISRPAVSKHVKILAESGLVVMRQQGRERYCEVQWDKLREVAEWVDQYRKMWEQRFDQLEEYLKEMQGEESHESDK